MIKSMFKIFMIGILCGNLLLLDINYKLGTLGFSPAYSQDSGGIKQEESDIKDGNLLSTLTMISIGTITSRLVACKTTPDIIAAAAGGAAFIAGEILAFAKLKKDLKGYEEYIKNDLSAEELNHQVAIFEKIREGYKRAVDTSNTKIKLQQAAAAAFVVAAGLATSFYLSVSTSLGKCTTALSQAASSCYAAYAASCVPPSKCYEPFKMGAMGFMKSIPSRVASFAGYSVPAPSTGASAKDVASEATAGAADSSSASMCPAGGAAPAVCAGYATIKANFGGVCPAGGLVASAEQLNTTDSLATNLMSLRSINPTFFSAMMLKMIASEANAFSFLGVAASSAVKFIIATSKVIGLKIDMFLYNPKNRAIIWGVLAGLTYAASKSTGDVVEELNKRISKIDEIIADLKSRGIGQQIAKDTNKPNGLDKNQIPNGANGGINAIAPGSNGEVDANNTQAENITLEEKLPCATKMVNGQCQSFEKSFLSSSGYESLDPMTKKELLSLAKNMDGINGKNQISGANLESLGKMGGNTNALNARLAKINKDIEKIAKDNNEPDVSSTRNGLKNDFLSAMNDELKKNGQSAKEVYASLSGLDSNKIFDGKASGDKALVGETKQAGMSDEDKAFLDQLNQLGTNNGAGYESPSPEELAGLSEAINRSESSDDLDSSGKQGIDLSKYDLNDISKDTGKNIFQMISDRYQKSGFTRLFPKRKAEMKLEDENIKGE